MQRSTLHRTQWLCAQGYHHLIDLMKAHRNTYLGIRSLMNSYVYVGLWVDRRAPGWAYMPSYNPSHEDAVKRIHQLLCLAKQLHLCSSLGLSFMIEGHSRSNSSANLVDSATATIAPQHSVHWQTSALVDAIKRRPRLKLRTPTEFGPWFTKPSEIPEQVGGKPTGGKWTQLTSLLWHTFEHWFSDQNSEQPALMTLPFFS